MSAKWRLNRELGFRRSMRKWLVGALIALVILFFGSGAYISSTASYWQETIGKPLEQELGFRHGTPYVREDGSSSPREVLTIDEVTPGGVFERAGFRSGDIVRGLSINGLFRLLHHGRGNQVTICVVDGGDGPPLDERRERIMTFEIPAPR